VREAERKVGPSDDLEFPFDPVRWTKAKKEEKMSKLSDVTERCWRRGCGKEIQRWKDGVSCSCHKYSGGHEENVWCSESCMMMDHDAPEPDWYEEGKLEGMR